MVQAATDSVATGGLTPEIAALCGGIAEVLPDVRCGRGGTLVRSVAGELVRIKVGPTRSIYRAMNGWLTLVSAGCNALPAMLGSIDVRDGSAIAFRWIEGCQLHQRAEASVRVLAIVNRLHSKNTSRRTVLPPVLRPVGNPPDTPEWPKIVERYKRMREPRTVPFGLIHGDLHTRNVVVDEHGHPWLIDFEGVRVDCVYVDHGMLASGLIYFGAMHQAVRSWIDRPNDEYAPYLVWSLARHYSRRQSTLEQRERCWKRIKELT